MRQDGLGRKRFERYNDGRMLTEARAPEAACIGRRLALPLVARVRPRLELGRSLSLLIHKPPTRSAVVAVDIQIGVQNFHVPSTTAAGLEPLLKKSNKRAPGPSPDHGTIWGAQGFPVRLIDGFAHTKETPTSLPTAHQPTRSPPVSYPAGRELRWRANMKPLLASLLLLFSTRAEARYHFHYWAYPFPQHCLSAARDAQAARDTSASYWPPSSAATNGPSAH